MKVSTEKINRNKEPERNNKMHGVGDNKKQNYN